MNFLTNSMKDADTKDHLWYDSICMKSPEEANSQQQKSCKGFLEIKGERNAKKLLMFLSGVIRMRSMIGVNNSFTIHYKFT